MQDPASLDAVKNDARSWNPLRNLPVRISFFVFASTLIASLSVTAYSVRTVDSFLREKIDQKFPSILATTRSRIDTWYEQRELEIGVFARSEILTANVPNLAESRPSERAKGETEQYLSYVLESFSQYDCLILLGEDGSRLLSVGRDTLPEVPLSSLVPEGNEPSLSDLLRIGDGYAQIVSAPIGDHRDRRVGSIHALIPARVIDELLESDDLGESGEIVLVNRSGLMIAGMTGERGTKHYSRPLPEGDEPVRVSDYEDDAGIRLIGAALPMERLGWTLTVEERYEEAFLPVVTAIRGVAGVSLVIVVVCGLVAFQIVVSIMKPVVALANSVRRISKGEENVTLPTSTARDEVGVLLQSFADMKARLEHNAKEIAQSHDETELANEQLREHNDELHRMNEVLEQLSITDGLTKLHNHRFFQDQLARETRRVDRSSGTLVLILMDIDHFKHWNDRLGHATGDEILRKMAEVLIGGIRESDLLARYGGEEFAVLLSDTSLEDAVVLAEKLRMRVSETSFVITPPSERDHVTISAGVAQYSGDRMALFNAADAALYRAKASGRDCVMVANEEEMKATESDAAN